MAWVKRWGFVLRRGPVLVPYSQTSSNKREGTTCTYLQLVDAHLHMRWQRCTRVRPTGRGCRRWLVDEGPRAGRGRRHTHTHTWVAPETNPDPFFRQRASSNHIGSDPIRVSPYGSGEYGVYTESEWEPFALFQTSSMYVLFRSTNSVQLCGDRPDGFATQDGFRRRGWVGLVTAEVPSPAHNTVRKC